MAGATFGRLGPPLPEGLEIVAQNPKRSIEQRHLDRCAPARLLTRKQAGEYAAESMHACHLIDRGNGAADIPAALVAGHRHDAAEGLQDHIVPGRIFQRSGPAESGDAAMNQPVVERTKARGIDAQPLGNAGAEAFNGDVGGSRELVYELAPLVRLHVDRDASLVAIGTQKHRAEAGRGKGWPAARLVSLPHRLDLDDFGAEIAEILRAKRTCEHLRKIENLDTVKRFWHDFSPCRRLD